MAKTDDKPKPPRRTQAVRIQELEQQQKEASERISSLSRQMGSLNQATGQGSWVHPDGGKININVHSAPMIYERMANVMQEVGHIGKDRRTAGSGSYAYNFRGIDDAYNALHGVMAKHQVFCIPRVVSWQQEGRKTAKGHPINVSILDMEFTFYTVDGSSVTARTLGEGMDSGDKSANKSMSVAQKYCLLQTFLIPTEEGASFDPDLTVEPLAEREPGAAPPKSSKRGSKKGGSSASEPSKSSDGGQTVELDPDEAQAMVEKYRERMSQVDTDWAMMQIKHDLEPYPQVRDALRDEWLVRLKDIRAGKAKTKGSTPEPPPPTDDDVPAGEPDAEEQGKMLGGGS